MLEALIYSLLSLLIISLISLLGIFTLAIKSEKLEKILIYMIAFSAGGLLGDSFIHLLPEATLLGFNFKISSFILLGIIFTFSIEKIVHWRHCHHPTTQQHPHHLSTMNLIGDGVHNLIDGIIIAASYLVSISLGIATTLAVIFHEIPQEIGDFGILIYSGLSKSKALLFNFLISLSAFLGAFLVIIIGINYNNILLYILSFTAGTFIYIACSDLIPELHKDKEVKIKRAIGQITSFIIGILIMVGLKLIFS